MKSGTLQEEDCCNLWPGGNVLSGSVGTQLLSLEDFTTAVLTLNFDLDFSKVKNEIQHRRTNQPTNLHDDKSPGRGGNNVDSAAVVTKLLQEFTVHRVHLMNAEQC